MAATRSSRRAYTGGGRAGLWHDRAMRVVVSQFEGIDTTRIGREAAHNIGIYSVQTDAAGERSFHYWRDASAARQLFGSADDLAVLDGAEILYLSAITLAIIAPAAREASAQVRPAVSGMSDCGHRASAAERDFVSVGRHRASSSGHGPDAPPHRGSVSIDQGILRALMHSRLRSISLRRSRFIRAGQRAWECSAAWLRRWSCR